MPPILRVYSLGFVPREFLANLAAAAQLADEVQRTDDDLRRFQQVVRRGASIQNEVLKAYVLCTFAQVSARLTQDMISPGNLLNTLDQILDNCCVVPGDNVDASFSFGRDFILNLRNTAAFVTIIVHELGHHVFHAAMASGLKDEKDNAVLPQEICAELACELPRLLDGALKLKSEPLRPGDQRHFRVTSGMSVLCTYVQLPRGSYIHFSFTTSAGPINLTRARLLAFFILRVLSVESAQVATAYSPRGVFHFGFLAEDPKINVLESRIQNSDLKRFTKDLEAGSESWLDEMKEAGRLGHAEGDIRVALGLEAKRPTVYGADPENTWRDLEVCQQVRSGAQLQDATTDALNELLCLAVHCADSSVASRLLEAGASPHAQ